MVIFCSTYFFTLCLNLIIANRLAVRDILPIVHPSHARGLLGGVTEEVVRVENLVKRYGGTVAADHVSFTVGGGEIFGMLGPNGAGKTSTIEVLEGLRKGSAGDVSVLGLDPRRDSRELHKRIGVIPQGFRFFDKAKPREAVRYYADLFGVRVDADELLRMVMLEDSADRLFEDLSGGQKQKLGFALSLVNDPDLLFLDEPTTGLDPQARRAVWKIVRDLKDKGKSVLLTTHYIEEAERLADRVAIMNRGKIIAEGSPGELVSRYGTGKEVIVKGESLEDIFVKLAGATIEEFEAGEAKDKG